ncbi:NAD-dependent succinate-semialdehyde dehydrogenase [Vibrio rumoiensis]|uniref:Succinate-semialdehyde dehydrogenase (NADP(+)) n=1 Tax=Vibrio rumoiensis 1S-45 TaxID=1188252 RepID=A0A1E5E5J0_9VIBR|nr:NAD-dependent succinate-semialdehyde dehydrogenase [Vibrio rumoiensis]OEF29071.1 succinate-semialdehyde dehydrogenase (NADP(+)) [Vibrio rumoiensis 1S-45]
MEQLKNQTLLASVLIDGKGQQVFNPFDNSLLGTVAMSCQAKIEQDVLDLEIGQKAWQKKPAAERCRFLKKWHQLILENEDDLAMLITLECGKPLKEALGEVRYGASFIEWFAEEGRRAYGSTIPSATNDRTLLTVKQAVGVAAAITPWNFPLAMITRKGAPALAAGCSFICKPSELTPLTAFAVTELAYQAGIPKDVLRMVVGESAHDVGEVFTYHSSVRKFSFTGSTLVGRKLQMQCASTIKRTSMELGGNAPFIVFDDADIDHAVKGAIASKFRNAGQTCVCANRFYVQDAVYDEFIDKLVAEVDKLKVGNGLDESTDIGPVITKEAKKRLLDLIEEAKGRGAKQVNKDVQLEGQFVAPTVLVDVEHDRPIVQGEIFGPILPIIRFEHEDEMIAMANDTIYGLAAYFYSQDMNRIWRVAHNLEYGMVGVNEGVISTEVAPFGGVKQSGNGKEGAKEGLEEYLETKYVCIGGLER